MRFECANLIASLGVPPEMIKELAIPLSEWILGHNHLQPLETVRTE